MTTTRRELSGYTSPYFVSSSGNEYDSHQLAWRYLGIYLDSDGYTRKILWAAYYDSGYQGNEIGEYQYYDWKSNYWDDSTCKSSRCAKMDCHDVSSSTWKLVGVYKESLDFGGDAFFEQLFKHQGYCLWGEDSSDYQFMQSMREGWEGSCQKVYTGYSSAYIGTKPMTEGNMTYGVYKDSYCKNAASYSVSKYLGNGWDSDLDQWNELMMAYKVCQPCRAYSRTKNSQYNYRRHLGEQNDGQGDEEMWGFNCYDDADYQNCNQCYKFETHTDMEEASSSDLSRASRQGTILSITYLNGVSYGSGTVGKSYSSSSSSSTTYNTTYGYHTYVSSVGFVLLLVVVVAVAATAFGGGGRYYRCRKRRIVVDGNANDQPLAQS